MNGLDWLLFSLFMSCTGFLAFIILVAISAGIYFLIAKLWKKFSKKKHSSEFPQDFEEEPESFSHKLETSNLKKKEAEKNRVENQEFNEEPVSFSLEQETANLMKKNTEKNLAENQDFEQEPSSYPLEVENTSSEIKGVEKNRDENQGIDEELVRIPLELEISNLVKKEVEMAPTDKVRFRRGMPGFLSRIKDWFVFHNQANLDYMASRGTQHQKQIRSCLPNLRKRIKQIRIEAHHCEKQLVALDKARDKRLTGLLKEHLITTRLIEVQGVGPKLAERIRKRVYRGNLRDLHRASANIQGIGQSKQLAISNWVRVMERDFNNMLKQNFSGKEVILEKHRSEGRVINIRLATAKQDLEEVESLKKVVESALKKLEVVTSENYYKALVGETVMEVSQHSMGLFAPWESPPEWFKTLLNDFED